MKMKEVCTLTQLNKRTIHFYINEKLIEPDINPSNNYYEFSESDCQKLIFIKNLRNAGLSLELIQSIMNTPASANYYFNRHMSKLKHEKRYIEQVLSSMKYIMDELPLFPDFSSLYDLCNKANIPSDHLYQEDDSNFESYNVVFINQLLWGAFLPKSKFSDYQEFLWTKLHKITFEDPSEEYKKVANYINQLPSKQIDQMISNQTTRYMQIANLNKEENEAFIQDMIHRIQQNISDPNCRIIWKELYDSYLQPTTAIHDSDLSHIVMELSPFYQNYVKNIHSICQGVYEYLHSDKGSELLKELETKLDGKLDLECNKHGQLEAFASVSDVTM